MHILISVNIMKYLYVLILTFLFCINSSLIFGEEKSNLNCLEKDREYADFWKNYYDPEEAYKFGETIKHLVKEKNLKSLFDLVEGELNSGPRKEFVNGKKFSDIFSNKWRKSFWGYKIKLNHHKYEYKGKHN